MIIIFVGFKVCEQCIVRSLLFHVKMCEISFHETKCKRFRKIELQETSGEVHGA